MDAMVRSRLFEPYFTTKPLGKGTGLGLASVYGCVKSHKGHIVVQSEVGRGSSFRLRFPLHRGEPTLPPAVEPGSLRGKGRILVIDDEEIVRNTVIRMLRSMGYQVEACSDGHEGVEHYRNHPGQVDLVILDLVMPRIGGREVFHMLKAIDPAVRVVLTSGFTRHEVTDELLSEGALGFIGKPMRIEDLSRQVHAAMTAGPAGQKA
jgi:CheY-like chemotaxis protein